jgi:hypothetical protein
MPKSKDACMQPPISIQNLALAVEAVHRGVSIPAEAKQFVLHALPFRDILMLTRDVVLNNSPTAINVQYGQYSHLTMKAS